MRSTLEKRFQTAASKRAGHPDVGLGWPVFKKYAENRIDDDIFLDAIIEPLPRSRLPDRSSANWHDAEERSIERRIAPVTQHKDLFLRFARLLPSGRVPMEEATILVSEWVHEYGVLGLDSVDDPLHPGHRESVRGFWRAASDAAMVLELYEAAIPKTPKRRLGEVLAYWEGDQNWDELSDSKQREYALERVSNKVGQIVKDECYPQLWREVNTARGKTRGFTYDFGFRSLLGAMYLQMMWLLTDANNVRKCARPGCPHIIPPSSNKNRMYHSNACKQWAFDNKDD